MSFDDMHKDAYYAVSDVLDDALGPNEEDGAGEGLVADVMLLAHRYKLALAGLAVLPGGAPVLNEVKAAQLPDPFEGMAS